MNGIENDMSYNPRIIQAHTSDLAAMALNSNGTLLATASRRVRFTMNRRNSQTILFIREH